MKTSPFYFIYHLIALPILFFLAVMASVFNNKIRKGLSMRRQILPCPLAPADNPLWFHCSSGEFEYAKPVIREMKIQDPKVKILVTYFSPTYKSNIESCEFVDYSCPLPLDFPSAVKGFIKSINPKALLIARTDLWPEVLQQCKKHNVPTVLFSRTQKGTNFLSKQFSFSYKWIFNLLSEIYTVSEEDSLNLRAVGVQTKVTNIGDTRFDQVIYRTQQTNPNFKNSLKPSNNRPTFIAGSTWPEDEKVIAACLCQLVKDNKINLIIAPHEPTKEHLKNLGLALTLPVQLYSETNYFKDNQVLVVDCVGVLADLYKISDVAFIGGSFKGSTHSVMEALAAGCPTFVGPHHKNNREAMMFKSTPLVNSTSFSVIEVSNTEGLRLKLEELLLGSLSDLRVAIKQQVKGHTGSTHKLINSLKNHNII